MFVGALSAAFADYLNWELSVKLTALQGWWFLWALLWLNIPQDSAFSGLDTMKKSRAKRRKDGGSKLKDFQLCNGPSKLCEAFCIEKANLNKEDMVTSKRFWLEDDQDRETKAISVVTSTRIGIDSYGPEWALKLLRFYVFGSKCVSMRDKNAEAVMLSNIYSTDSPSSYTNPDLIK